MLDSEHVEISLKGWNKNLDGLKIAVVGDIHAGWGPHENRRVQAVVDEINSQKPDIILLVGDYVTFDNSRLVIDRKQNLSEIYQNLCHDFTRFERELNRAQKFKIKIIILCEHGGGIRSLEDVVHWQNPQLEKTPYAWDGRKLYREMLKIKKLYNQLVLTTEKALSYLKFDGALPLEELL